MDYNGENYQRRPMVHIDGGMESYRDMEAIRKLSYVRRMPYGVFVLCLLLILSLLPIVGERWAYSTQKGVERAKYEAAKKFFEEHPETAG
ncbi:MAG: hypothetical protein KIG81_05525, partial [Thermoguttaceae bacterium]|nr:hypothetical protein [Thermoguttaceae bacterium]